jgi:predicted nucleotidyltransferase
MFQSIIEGNGAIEMRPAFRDVPRIHQAQASFKTLQSRYPHVLGGHSPLIRRVELGEKGIFYRAQIGPFDTVEQAKQLCARLKSAGGRCVVQKSS